MSLTKTSIAVAVIFVGEASVTGIDPGWQATAAFAAMASAFTLILRWMLNTNDQNMRKLTDSVNLHSIAIVNLQKQLMAHHLSASGINAGLGGDADERTQRAIELFNSVQHDLKDITERLNEKVKA